MEEAPHEREFRLPLEAEGLLADSSKEIETSFPQPQGNEFSQQLE